MGERCRDEQTLRDYGVCEPWIVQVRSQLWMLRHTHDAASVVTRKLTLDLNCWCCHSAPQCDPGNVHKTDTHVHPVSLAGCGLYHQPRAARQAVSEWRAGTMRRLRVAFGTRHQRCTMWAGECFDTGAL
jgi:hypothetical protein